MNNDTIRLGLNGLKDKKIERPSMVISQPLNVIAKDGLDKSSFDNFTTNNDFTKGVNNYNEICTICQIKNIVGTCKQCGIYQYGIMENNNQPSFDITVRRRRNVTNTEPSDVKSDS